VYSRQLAAGAVPAAVTQEILLVCEEESTVGFRWDEQGKVSDGKFLAKSFTVQVLSDVERRIHWAGMPGVHYQCRPSEGGIHCRESDGAVDLPIIFGKDGFTRAFLYCPPAGGDPNIYISYGTCIGQ
jgi:hypothetical protein